MSDTKRPPSLPIKSVKELAESYGYNMIVAFGWDKETGQQSMATYGKSLEDCDFAAKFGNAWKKQLGWPDNLCNTKTARQKKKEKADKEQILSVLNFLHSKLFGRSEDGFYIAYENNDAVTPEELYQLWLKENEKA